LPEQPFASLVKTTGNQLQRQAQQPPEWLWQGRTVEIVDHTDHPRHARESSGYPQHTTQPPAQGISIARLVVIFSLSVEAVSEYALGHYQGKRSGENRISFQASHSQEQGLKVRKAIDCIN
jgi:hypothetical protein